jgi:hypothetical protein
MDNILQPGYIDVMGVSCYETDLLDPLAVRILTPQILMLDRKKRLSNAEMRMYWGKTKVKTWKLRSAIRKRKQNAR